MGDIRQPNGVVLEGSLSLSTLSASCVVGKGVLGVAEAATEKIIRKVQPTVVSEERRRDVVDYVQRLLKLALGSEVFPFGSVPLKTYLPDGDIDLTAFCGFNFEEAFAKDVYSVLVAQDLNPAAKFIVKDVQYIRAEVQLVKCLVQNIVVDISFNQIGGLCALGFLEEIDRLIGKDHLFKRSIILIKAWCYYESRILGAHHGLISTYALETLVLYIFHLFHASLDGPLAVLHKFLDYFSKFDWDKLCVSLSGPLLLASLPETLTDKPETSGEELLLSDDFMRECVRKFSVPSKGADAGYKTFMTKYLNIVDPLKENNNLGRSVSKGNFFRIRSAFSYGARKLGQILSPSQENVAEEVCKFFGNTLDRHGNGQRPDVQDQMQLSSCNGFDSELSSSFGEPFRDQINTHEENCVRCASQSSENRPSFDDTHHVIVSSFREAGANIDETNAEHKNGFEELSEDANELAASGIPDLRITELGDDFGPSVLEDKQSPLGCLPLENGKIENGHLDEDQHTDSGPVVGGRTHLESNGSVSWEHDNDSWQDTHSECQSTRSGETGRHEIVNLLPDLSGDFDCHLDNLHYGRWLYDQGSAMLMHPIPMLPPPPFHNVSWDTMHPTAPLRQDVASPMGVNAVIPRPPFFPTNPPPPHFVDDMPKHRGVGTYFPITNPHSYRDRPSPKGRYQGHLKSPRTNGRGPMIFDRNFTAQGLIPPGIGRPKFPDHHESSPRGKVYKETNGFIQAREKAFEHDPPENQSPEAETCGPPDSLPSSGSQNFEPVFVVDDNRISVNSYRLKDDEDFPPLCA